MKKRPGLPQFLKNLIEDFLERFFVTSQLVNNTNLVVNLESLISPKIT